MTSTIEPTLRRVCVFCGSRPGAKPTYAQNAKAFAGLLAESKIGLVYGGASVGLMGMIADTVIRGGGDVIGVIPQVLVKREVAHPALGELKIVQTMHERKATMAELSDAFVALPGGFGTLEELFEVITWAELGMHAKPIGLLNTDGYYDKLNQFIDHVVEEGFLPSDHTSVFLIDSDPKRLLDRLIAYKPKQLAPKWIDVKDV